MSSKLIPANPADVMVIRDLTPNVVTLSVPFTRGGKIKFGGRATLVRLSSGSLAVFSPVALTPDVRAKIDALVASGSNPAIDPARKVSHIVATDREHHIFLSEWKAAYPGAKLIGPNGLPEKRKQQAASGSDDKIRDDPFAVVFPDGPSKLDVTIDAEFDADFSYEFVDSHVNKEIVFLYRPDRVLIEADLVFNMPPTEQYQRVPEAERAPGLADRLFWGANTLEGDLKWARRLQWHLMSRGNRPSFNESIARIAEWDFDTLVPCHGETVVGGAKAKFVSLFEWHLKAVAK
jgi:hypothetical protein